LYRVHLTKYQNGTHDYGLMFSWWWNAYTQWPKD
jgi:hypothetical protein